MDKLGITPKQKEVLMAICKEGKAKEVTSSKFLRTYKLTANSVQGALKGLLEKDFVTMELGVYRVYNRFFELWLRRKASYKLSTKKRRCVKS